MIVNIFFIIIILLILDISFSLYRAYKRYYLYKEASLKAKNTNKKLLVIGDPNSGFFNKNIYKCYECGDICLDINGCNDCSKQIKGDLVKEIKKMKSNKYVIFESCVLEYINNINMDDINNELQRVSGGDLYQVRNFPNIMPLHYKFIELG